MSSVLESIFGQKVGHPVLFREFCRSLELDKKTVKVLSQISSKICPEMPAMLFIDPTVMRKGVKLPEVADSVEILRELYYKWFGGAI